MLIANNRKVMKERVKRALGQPSGMDYHCGNVAAAVALVLTWGD